MSTTSTRRVPHKQRTIEKIRNAKVLERLLKHFAGDLELSATQVNVGLALLKKCSPDLKAVEVSGNISGETPDKLSDAELNNRIADLLTRTATGRKAQKKGKK